MPRLKMYYFCKSNSWCKDEKTDLIIIGGGILGTFHAYWALQRGFSVRIFEKNNRPRGATVRNFGQIVPSGMDHKWQNYGRRSLDIYKNLDQQIGLGIQYQGSTYIASDSEEWTLLQELYEINQAQEYSSVLWAAEQCQQQIPNLKSTYCKGALFLQFDLGTTVPGSLIPSFFTGTGVYLPYILFHCLVFERLIALLRFKGNIGFLFYIADSLGYAGSVAIMLFKELGQFQLTWVNIFVQLNLFAATLILLLTLTTGILLKVKLHQKAPHEK